MENIKDALLHEALGSKDHERDHMTLHSQRKTPENMIWIAKIYKRDIFLGEDILDSLDETNHTDMKTGRSRFWNIKAWEGERRNMPRKDELGTYEIEKG